MEEFGSQTAASMGAAFFGLADVPKASLKPIDRKSWQMIRKQSDPILVDSRRRNAITQRSFLRRDTATILIAPIEEAGETPFRKRR